MRAYFDLLRSHKGFGYRDGIAALMRRHDREVAQPASAVASSCRAEAGVLGLSRLEPFAGCPEHLVRL